MGLIIGMSVTAYLLSFLEPIHNVAAANAKKMEELLYQDPGSAVVKARVFAEVILSEVLKSEDAASQYLPSMYDKIVYLSKEGVLTSEIQTAFDTIRFTGNKAAHDGTFDDLGKALSLHKVMYKIAVWFCEVYSSEQLQIPPYEHPKPPVLPNKPADLEDIVRNQVLQLLGGAGRFQVAGEVEEVEEETIFEQQGLLKKDLPQGSSYLLRELKRLQDSSQEAIENANAFSEFKKYLHVTRKIQTDLEDILIQNKDLDKANLILLCGSVGDGKSHLLAYLKENKPELINKYQIFNDATESFSPNRNAMETLEGILKDFSDQMVQSSKKKVILAINMGVLHNFISLEHQGYTYHVLSEFVEESGLFSPTVTTSFSQGSFSLISFGDYHPYELTKDGTQSSFFSQLLDKIFNEDTENPFYQAYQEDLKNNVRSMVHENYEFMQDSCVRKQIINLVVKTLVQFKLVISARAFLNFVADIVIPDQIQHIQITDEFEKIEQSVPGLLFGRKERSVVLRALSDLDPIHLRSEYIDQLIIDLNTLLGRRGVVGEYIPLSKGQEWLAGFLEQEDLADSSLRKFGEAIVRLAYLTNEGFSQKVESSEYMSFVKRLFFFNAGVRNEIKIFYNEIKEVLFKWRGSPKKDYIYLNNPSDPYRLAQRIALKPTVEHLRFSQKDIFESFKATILLAYHGGNGADRVYLEIDYPLYNLLMKVKEGYCPNKKDEEDAIKFVEFIKKIMNFGEKRQELLIHFPGETHLYTLKRDEIDGFSFAKE